MADEKNFNEEEIKDAAKTVEETAKEAADTVAEATEEAADAVTETVEEAADAAGETAESVDETAEAVDETTEQMSEVDRAVAEAMAARDAQEAAEKAAKSKKTQLIAIIAAAVVIVAGIVCSGFVSRGDDSSISLNTYSGWLPKLVNKYNHMGYVDVTGRTVGDLAKDMGVEVSDFLEEFELPADMPASTYEMAAVYMLPTKNYGQMYGIDFATMKDMFHIPDTMEDGTEITEDTPWGDAQGEIKVGDYVGDTGDGKALESFKETYNFGDEVTAETKWKEVRSAVDEAQRKRNMEGDEAENSADTTTDDTAADDTAADDTAADDTTADGNAADANEAPADNAAADSAE